MAEFRRPIVTLTSDFGLSDTYVAAMKGVLIKYCSWTRLIDVTHQIPRHDVLSGSIALERAVDGFPDGTIHLAVVDPGVGTDRRLLVCRIRNQFILCPDNGLITWAWQRHGPGKCHTITWRPKRSSHTFHGRDILAPVAGMLARGEPLESLTEPASDPILLPLAPASPASRAGRIIHVDHFGNATTNVTAEMLRALKAKVVRVKGREIGKLKRTYWDVAPGKPLALIGSSGLLEIAVRDGSASDELRLQVGDEVKFE